MRFSHKGDWNGGVRLEWRISRFYKVQLGNPWRRGDDLQSSRRDAIWSSPLDPRIFLLAVFCRFPRTHCNDPLSSEALPAVGIFSFLLSSSLSSGLSCCNIQTPTLSAGHCVHWRCLEVNLWWILLLSWNTSYVYGCQRSYSVINCATGWFVSLPHCWCKCRETLHCSFKCQGSISTYRESCLTSHPGSSIASCGFRASMGAVRSWPVYHRWLWMFTRELMTQLKLNEWTLVDWW